MNNINWRCTIKVTRTSIIAKGEAAEPHKALAEAKAKLPHSYEALDTYSLMAQFDNMVELIPDQGMYLAGDGDFIVTWARIGDPA